jgi:hypothetical protein
MIGKNILFIILNSLTISLFSQTCTSSGGDMPHDLDYLWRCGNSRARKYSKKHKGPYYEQVEGCNNYWTEGIYYQYKNKIFYNEDSEYQLVKSADAKSFSCEGGNAKDKKYYYYKGKKVEGFEMGTIKTLNYFYITDNKTVYYKDRNLAGKALSPVASLEKETFEIIGDSLSPYAKDVH